MEDEHQVSYPNNCDTDKAVHSVTFNTLEGWTKDEKYDLFQGLKAFGSSDIEKIHSLVPNKTTEQIKTAINHYKKIAFNQSVDRMKKRKRNIITRTPRIPLAFWAKSLTDVLHFKQLQTETATALRIIADFEDIPPSSCTDNIDFRKIYHVLANAVDGKAVTEDKSTDILLEKCVLETALTSKSFMKASAYRTIVHSVNISDTEINAFPRPTENRELSTLRYLASRRTYNPLNISEDFLKPSFHNTIL